MDNAAYIDNKPYAINPGETILEFVRRHRGRDLIPTLCQADNLENYGSCRLCSVAVAKVKDGPTRVLASCHTPVTPGQYLYPSSAGIQRLRRNILELMLSDYPSARLHPAPGRLPTEFQRTLAALGIPAVRYPPGARHPAPAPDLDHPYIRADMTECIGCFRCVRACDELQAGQVLAVAGRGIEARVIAGADQRLRDSPCVACGACVQTCPTNALTDRYGTKTAPFDRLVPTICTYCGVGCNLEVRVRDDRIQGIQGVEQAAVNRGHSCVKGRFAFEFHCHPDRLTQPLIRRDGQLQPATWDQALDYCARRFQEIKDRHGPDALAGISSARCTNEENYLMQKFFRVVIGTNNIDGCARVCHAPTALGMQWTLGTGAATNSVADLDSTACILIIGANPTAAHPVTGARIKAVVQRGVPLIIIDPLRTDLARYAQYHLRPRPGTNLALLNLFARAILDASLIDEDFIDRRTEGWADFAAHLRGLDIAAQTRVCGVPWDLIQPAACAYASAPAAMAFHGLGVTEHWQGTKAVALITALALMTGNLGRPGTGVNPLRGQNNVQGAADMGVQPHQGPGYLAVDDPLAQARYEKFYGVPFPAKPGYKIPEMFAASTRGDLKALWVMGEDLLPGPSRPLRSGIPGSSGTLPHRHGPTGGRRLPCLVLFRKGGHLHQCRTPGATGPAGHTPPGRHQARWPHRHRPDEAHGLSPGTLLGAGPVAGDRWHSPLLSGGPLGGTGRPGQTMARGRGWHRYRHSASRDLQTRPGPLPGLGFRGDGRTEGAWGPLPLHPDHGPAAGALQQRHHDPPHP